MAVKKEQWGEGIEETDLTGFVTEEEGHWVEKVLSTETAHRGGKREEHGID